MEIKQIVFELPLSKETKNRVKYGTEGKEEWKSVTVGGMLYPTKASLANAFGRFPSKIKVTIEEV